MYSLIFGGFSGVLLLLLHYFPYPKVIGRRLHRPEAYLLGTLAITFGQLGVWFVAPGEFPFALLVVPAACGACVLGAWWFDAKIELLHKERDNQDAATWDTDCCA